MRGIIIAHINSDTALRLKQVLLGSGLPVLRVCSSAQEALRRAASLPDGGVVLASFFADMSIAEFRALLNKSFEILLLASGGQELYTHKKGVTTLLLPLNRQEFLQKTRHLLECGSGAVPKRSDHAKELILQAKELLISTGLSEAEAHNQLQKKSMNSGLSMAKVAESIIKEAKI
ncbi:MAG: ANTAR domain-containing protein [Oscillospiraceae bacterium]|jgi:hypothetical protein|nr:ANTAR domain-containing protein [Oscillospiraceae bacterium]